MLYLTSLAIKVNLIKVRAIYRSINRLVKFISKKRIIEEKLHLPLEFKFFANPRLLTLLQDYQTEHCRPTKQTSH